jgi:hypothetical protein
MNSTREKNGRLPGIRCGGVTRGEAPPSCSGTWAGPAEALDLTCPLASLTLNCLAPTFNLTSPPGLQMLPNSVWAHVPPGSPALVSWLCPIVYLLVKHLTSQSPSKLWCPKGEDCWPADWISHYDLGFLTQIPTCFTTSPTIWQRSSPGVFEEGIWCRERNPGDF